MTSSLRRKHRITVPAPSTPNRMASSLLSFGLLLAGANAFGQQASYPQAAPSAVTQQTPIGSALPASAQDTLHFVHEPVAPATNPIHLAKEAGQPDSAGALRFSKEATSTGPVTPDSLRFGKEAISASPA